MAGHDSREPIEALRKAAPLANLPARKKLLLLAFNALPLLQLALTAGLMALGWPSWWRCLLALVGMVYLAPPLVCQAVTMALPIRRRMIPVGSRDFFVWWFTLNLQTLYSRFPLLEELLRVLPSCYSLWLRLWGARIGKLTYWAPGVAILDRPWLQIGDHVILGAGVRISGHLFISDRQGQFVLALAPVRIGDRVMVGGHSVLGPGASIASDQCTRAFLVLPPFSRLVNGRRVKRRARGTSTDRARGKADDDEL